MNRQSLFILLCLSLLVVFQNCGSGVRLSHMDDPIKSETPPSGITVSICPSLSAEGTSANYIITRIHVVNLSTTLWQGALQPDSDMDGVSDGTETAWGFLADNPRTMGLLDSVCQRLGGSGICQKNPTCTGAWLAPGLTDCDMGNFQSPTTGGIQGFDSDQDGIPDLIELVRGTDPVAVDDNLDYDSDASSNMIEILRGTDVQNPGLVPVRQQIQFRRTDTSIDCGAGEKLVKVDLENFPIVKVNPVTISPPFVLGSKAIDLSHDKDENVIAIYYIAEPDLSAILRSEIYMSIIKVKLDGTASANALTDADFVYLGEIRQ